MPGNADPLSPYEARVRPGSYAILRLDGRRFGAATAGYRPPLEIIARTGIIAPFHLSLHEAMLAATAALMEAVPADVAYTASDEISLVIAPDEADFYGGRLDKWLSVAAGTASAALAQNVGSMFTGLPVMDARAFAAGSMAEVEGYLRDRVFSSWRNCRNAYVWHTIAAQGHIDPRDIEARAQALGHDGRTALLMSTPVNPSARERLGTFAVWTQEERDAVHRPTGADVKVSRRDLRFVEIERLDADLSGILSIRRRR